MVAKVIAFLLFAIGCGDPLHKPVESAMHRWHRSTGLNVPSFKIELVDPPLKCSSQANARGCFSDKRIRINKQIVDDERLLNCVVLHEIGHVLAKRKDHATGDSQVMRASTIYLTCRITDVDIDYVCQNNDCTIFVPEK